MQANKHRNMEQNIILTWKEDWKFTIFDDIIILRFRNILIVELIMLELHKYKPPGTYSMKWPQAALYSHELRSHQFYLDM